MKLRVYSLGKAMPEFRRLWDDPQTSLYLLRKKYGLTNYSMLYMVHLQGMSIDRQGRHAGAQEVRKFVASVKRKEALVRAAKHALVLAFQNDPAALRRKGKLTPENVRKALRLLYLAEPKWVSEFLEDPNKFSHDD